MAGLSRQDAINLYGTEAYTAWDPTAASADFQSKGGHKGNQTLAQDQAAQTQSQNTGQAIDSAQKFQNFSVNANLPAIATEQASMTSGQTAYDKQIADITRRTIQNQNATLAARGIQTNPGGYGDTQIQQAVTDQTNPIATSKGQFEATTQAAIAQLQSPNPQNAINAALGLTTTPSQQAAINQAQAQTGLFQAQVPAAGLVPIPNVGVYDPKVNPLTNQPYGLVGGYNTNPNNTYVPGVGNVVNFTQ